MFELTNAQRRCFALPEVQPGWKKILLHPSPYDRHDTYAYMDGNRICKLIQTGEALYLETTMNETVSDDGTQLLPKTSKGKPFKLTAAALTKRTPVGMTISYCRGHIAVYHHGTQQNYYISSYEGVTAQRPEDFILWLEDWCAHTGEKELADIQAFADREKVHQNYQEGDFFRFRISRGQYGYGRILLDFNCMRKEKIPFWDIFMGKPLCVAVYHIVTARTDVSIEELSHLKMLPPQMIMDNIFFYGECEVIGNRPVLPEEEDYPIHYGRSISRGDDRLMYQCGRTFLSLEGAQEVCHGYRHGGIGRTLDVRRPVLLACIEAHSNAPFWQQEHFYKVREDLRNPCNREDLEKIRRQFGME